MSQESFFAKQEDSFSSFHNLFQHLGCLHHLHTQLVLDAFRQRQEKLLAPLREGRLQQPSAHDWWEYLTDFGQRNLLFWDTLRQRGDNTLAHERAGYPLLLKFKHEVLIDGRSLPHPVNYSLLRILPNPDQQIDDSRPPVIIIDPRGGHGAGIGGFKPDSEVGESLRAGHPTYFIAFSHAPEPGQTLLDIGEAEAYFIEQVRTRHLTTGKPVVIGNCQAGWALMGLAAARPELPGLVIINGAPLSYWAGVNGRNPMRYTGGLLGGAWMTRLGSDLGNGRFDGVWLVSNFESLDPANTYWSKYYNLFSQVDSEATRFLDFERWWGSPTLINSEEIENIVDDLFIGNRLAGSFRRRSGGIDLKRIEAPVVVFCSYGDNITPPQQALNWIADVYPSDLALRVAGRTIVYLRHASIGHLGIFVSGQVARREHRQLLGAIDAIQALPAGLFELVIDEQPGVSETGCVEYLVHFEPRRITDISCDEDDCDDEREFALVERASELNNTLYDWFVRPWMRRIISEPMAELIRKAHPFRQQQVAWSSLNPALWWLASSAEQVRTNRTPVAGNNPLLAWQALFSDLVETQLDTYRDTRDAVQEMAFHAFYGGLSTLTGGQRLQDSQNRIRLQDKVVVERLQEALPHGGRLEAVARILFLLERYSNKISKERIEYLIQQSRALVQQFAIDPLLLRDTIRLQSLLVFAHPEESLSTLPHLLPDTESRQRVLNRVVQLVPELRTAQGVVGEFWRDLHSLLDQPPPGFALPALTFAGQETPALPSPQAVRPEPASATAASPEAPESVTPEASPATTENLASSAPITPEPVSVPAAELEIPAPEPEPEPEPELEPTDTAASTVPQDDALQTTGDGLSSEPTGKTTRTTVRKSSPATPRKRTGKNPGKGNKGN
ncbi:DUF3141 domain-containing protein [Azomonas macrocytogenes]|uniref:Poly(3-hydroxyalkanoate) synthetase n=1 Tax=Azomonas macrocytogenes TaxID=69962 RepID=A0A839TBA3_AZOMA|nr:DUF3141 domain-containing protein [Azomonas macrocytogenes]MBB3104893.1 hypothetical protein [Azomonas macrocytogenes]